MNRLIKISSSVSVITWLLLSVLLISCEEETPYFDAHDYTFLDSDGFFFLNEGNFTWGNGSLSFYSYDSLICYNRLFQKVNGRPLGDVPQSMLADGGNAYIIINNSGRLEIIDLISLESVASVNGLVSPRNILLLPGNEAIISSLYSDSLTIINTLTHDITGYKNIDRSSEDMLLSGNNVFISNWSGGNTITVLDYTMMDIKGVINVVAEPGEMVIDKNNNIWVLCSGGYMNDENPALLRIDPHTLEVSKTIIFDDKNSSPKELCINSSGNMLYYINKDIFKFDITSDVIETDPIISADGRHLYSLEYDHKKNTLLVTDAVDYQQNGYVYIYDDEGSEINSILGGIIPASFCFK